MRLKFKFVRTPPRNSSLAIFEAAAIFGPKSLPHESDYTERGTSPSLWNRPELALNTQVVGFAMGLRVHRELLILI